MIDLVAAFRRLEARVQELEERVASHEGRVSTLEYKQEATEGDGR